MRVGVKITGGLFACMAIALSCKDIGRDAPSAPQTSADKTLFGYITTTDPFTAYSLFPRADSVTQGTLNGSSAHQPLVRVSMNAIALNALHEGSLPVGARFPDGSIIFKQIMMNGQVVLYAVLVKDNAHPLSANGWLWAEYHPDGTVAFSVTSRGSGCVGCHSREQGPEHDFVRTFERQR